MTKGLILEALLIPLFWFLMFVFFTSVGFVLGAFKRQSGTLSTNLFTWFWYGLGVCIVFLQIWNLFLPVNVYCWLCLLPVAIYGLTSILKSGRISIGRPTGVALILLIAILVFLVISSLDNLFIYDSLVYHFYSIKWFNNYPVIPGMGNLFIYLGFNQSYFLFPAFLNSIWGGYKGACAANGLLAVVICYEVILLNQNIFLAKAKFTVHVVFQL